MPEELQNAIKDAQESGEGLTADKLISALNQGGNPKEPGIPKEEIEKLRQNILRQEKKKAIKNIEKIKRTEKRRRASKTKKAQLKKTR